MREELEELISEHQVESIEFMDLETIRILYKSLIEGVDSLLETKKSS